MNQDIKITDFNQLISTLFNNDCDENYIITKLSEFAKAYQAHKEIIFREILNHFVNEKLITSKIKLFNIIDSLFKSVGQDYIDLFSPILFELFKATYLEASEKERIQLFKLFYTWKYIIDNTILDKIYSTLNFEQMKLKIIQLLPGTIERYDQYNEQMKASIKERLNKNKQMIKNESRRAINANINHNTNIKTSSIPNTISNTNINTNTNSSNPLMDLARYQAQNIKKNQVKEKPRIKEKVGLSDDLFSDSSPSNEQFSDDNNPNSNNNKKSLEEKNKVDHKIPNSNYVDNEYGIRTVKKQFYEKEENERTDEKNINIEKMKQKIKKEKNKHQKMLGQKRGGSPLSYNSQGQSQHRKQNLLSLINTNQIPNSSIMNIQSMSQCQNQNQTTANAMSQILQFGKMTNMNTQSNKPQSGINPYSNNPSLMQLNQMQQQTILQTQQYQFNRPPVSQYSNNVNLSPTELSLQHFLLESSVNIKESFTFFSALSKYFIDTYRQSKILPTTKTDIELFKSKDLYEQIHKHTYNTLFLSLRNICAVCGFRTKIYSKFIEHLDIHFHYNYLKKNSNNKVLCRKEGCNKESWITTSYMKNNNSYTLSAILYYQNDSDQMPNVVIYNPKEIEEDNEDLLYPVNYGEDAVCLYCGDQLKKKYFSKYHYWFYVKVINVKQNDLIISNNSLSLFDQGKGNAIRNNDDVLLLHESCVDEYVAKVSNQLQSETINN